MILDTIVGTFYVYLTSETEDLISQNDIFFH